MHELDLIRAATEDVASAKVLLQERTDALDAIIQTALDHGVSMDAIAKASEPAIPGIDNTAGAREHLLVA